MTSITAGSILWLPDTPLVRSIPNIETGALDHPVLILRAPPGSESVRNVEILTITSFHNTPLIEKHSGQSRRAILRRAEYLPLKRSEEEPHPDSGALLEVFITGNPQVTQAKQSYVGLLKQHKVAREHLRALSGGTARIGPADLKKVKKMQEVLRPKQKKRKQKRVRAAIENPKNKKQNTTPAVVPGPSQTVPSPKHVQTPAEDSIREEKIERMRRARIQAHQSLKSTPLPSPAPITKPALHQPPPPPSKQTVYPPPGPLSRPRPLPSSKQTVYPPLGPLSRPRPTTPPLPPQSTLWQPPHKIPLLPPLPAVPAVPAVPAYSTYHHPNPYNSGPSLEEGRYEKPAEEGSVWRRLLLAGVAVAGLFWWFAGKK